MVARDRVGAVMIMTALALLCAAVIPGDAAQPAMPNLLLPPWEPTYNLTKSTMTQSCFGPARISPVGPLTNTSGAFMRAWGIITIDFESQVCLYSCTEHASLLPLAMSSLHLAVQCRW